MASEALKLLNLSPIPELSEMELSNVLEQLSGLSDLNGQATDRNVEDILREAEELIDTSTSFRADSSDSKNSLKCEVNNNPVVNEESNCTDVPVSTEKNTNDDIDSMNDNMIFSTCSLENSQKIIKSESVKSVTNEIDSSQSEVISSHTPQSTQSLTNVIQSTLDSLRECSQKIENQTKNSPKGTSVPSKSVLDCKKDKVQDKTKDEETEIYKISQKNKHYFGEESEKSTVDNSNIAVPSKKVNNMKQNFEKHKNVRRAVKNLNFDEPVKAYDCFERLYRARPKRKVESKKTKTSENVKKLDSVKSAKVVLPSKSEIISKGRMSQEISHLKQNKKYKPYECKVFDVNYNNVKTKSSSLDNLIDEDISFETCLAMLDKENENGLIDVPTFNYIEFEEKMSNQLKASISVLQREIESLRSQLMRQKKEDLSSSWDSKITRQFGSQEHLIQTLREENSKLFKEIEEIKGQLRMGSSKKGGGDDDEDDAGAAAKNSSEKLEMVENLRSEVENLRRSLLDGPETDRVSRLEEKFSLLKQKYEQQIGKLEAENRRLKESLVEHNFSASTVADGQYEENLAETKADVAVQTEKTSEGPKAVTEGCAEMETTTRKDLIRSVSLENCAPVHQGSRSLSHSCENVDIGMPLKKNSFSQTERERCSASIQCRSDRDRFAGQAETAPSTASLQSERRKREFLGEFSRFENKENWEKRKTSRIRPSSSYAGHLLKQKKTVSEHENQLMITLRALHSEVMFKDKENKKTKNELELLKNQMKKMAVVSKCKSEPAKKCCHIGTQTIGFGHKMHEAYDPSRFQVSKELENENEELKSKLADMEKVIEQLKEKRVSDLQILQKLHEEEIDKLASRLSTQTALTQHLHSLLIGR